MPDRGRAEVSTSAASGNRALPEESDAWKQAYRDPELIARRTKKHRQKLQVLGVLQWPREGRLLDLCCGTGEVLRILHAEGFQGLHASDVTIDPPLQQEPWLTTHAADSRKLPYPDAHFDAITCLHSLHHLGGVSGISAALSEAKRVLKPGGRLGLIDHWDSAHLRLAFWACRQSWLTWPTSALRSYKCQLDEEWSYLTEYLDHWRQVRAVIDGLGFAPVEVDRKGLFFFYWVGLKR